MYDIRKRRKELNLSIEEIAKACKVSKATVSRWENGIINNMKRDKIALLCDALKCTPMDIIGGFDDDYKITDEIDQWEKFIEQNNKDKAFIIDKAKEFGNIINQMEINGVNKNELQMYVDKYNNLIAPQYKALMELYKEIELEYNKFKSIIMEYGADFFNNINEEEKIELKNYIDYLKSKRKG